MVPLKDGFQRIIVWLPNQKVSIPFVTLQHINVSDHCHNVSHFVGNHHNHLFIRVPFQLHCLHFWFTHLILLNQMLLFIPSYIQPKVIFLNSLDLRCNLDKDLEKEKVIYWRSWFCTPLQRIMKRGFSSPHKIS